jgi:hypothetical protein
MLRVLSRTLPVLQWAYRLAFLGALALAWNAYTGRFRAAERAALTPTICNRRSRA